VNRVGRWKTPYEEQCSADVLTITERTISALLERRYSAESGMCPHPIRLTGLKRRKKQRDLRFAPDERGLIGAVSPSQSQQIVVDFENIGFPPAVPRPE
jgi:hypothetical protein